MASRKRCSPSTHLAGIQLMPRIRNWKYLRFYRPEKGMRFRHIDRLFSDVSGLEAHPRPLADLILGIDIDQAGKNRLTDAVAQAQPRRASQPTVAAARELGRVLRLVYLLRWISSKEMRQEVSITTNKIESCSCLHKMAGLRRRRDQ